MTHSTLVSTSELADHLADPSWVLFDCRFNMKDSEAGRRAYREAHIPGAAYVHLDEDLSGAVKPDQTGRHPLPDPEAMSAKLGAWGVGSNIQVVVYDDAGGAIAGRLWWLLRWLGHDAVALLDGGITRWREEGRPLTAKVLPRKPEKFAPHIRERLVVPTEEVVGNLATRRAVVIDARARERFRGEQESVDPVAGHIPGAVNLPFQSNLGPDGRFLPARDLAALYRQVLGENRPEHTILMCGSGVTACLDLVAMETAGLPGARLYVGSWSEWITDPKRPVARGEG